jgi:ABC-2 type transport system ATP-binding protein
MNRDSHEFAVQVEGLTHRYGDRIALDSLSLKILTGEIFGLVGPNGGGKSTLFRILSTLIVPAAGTVRVFSHDVLSEPAKVRGLIGVVFQSPALDKKLTVKENLVAQGHLYGQSGARLKLKVEEGLKRMGLSERKNERTEKLSGGLKRRLEIAKALLHEPRLLLLDEPTTGLDPGMRKEVWELVRSLRDREGITVVATTHLMEEADQCHRIALLDRGKIVSMGVPGELRQTLGGDIISIRSGDPEGLRRRIEEKFSTRSILSDGEIRIEKRSGPQFFSELVSTFSKEIESITLGKPTLDDLFISKTGRRLSDDFADKGEINA